MLFDIAQERPDEVALDDLERQRTWSELAARSLRLARVFADELGARPGAHVAVLAGNRVELVELVTASMLAGTWLTPVNWHLTAGEVVYVLEDSGARAVFVDPAFESLAREVAGDLPVIVLGEELDALVAAAPDAPLDLSGPAGGNMFYTSGTTGRPKGVKRAISPSVEQQLRSISRSGTALGLDGWGTHLVTGPLYHAAPIGFALMDLHNGAPLVLMPRFDPRRTLELIEAEQVRNTHLVPTMFVRLLQLPAEQREAFDPSSLRTVLHGAAPIAPLVKQQMIEWWGPVLVEYWGGSEGGVVTVVDSREWLEHPGTVGRPLPNHEVFVADATGERRPPGEVGVLWVKNCSVERVFEYHNDPDKTEAAFAGPGTYTLGDMGWIDTDGYVYLADRVSNMIISGGVNIYPAEIEQVLIEHPAVADVAVFGIPDDEWGEQVKAAVELCDGYEPSPALETAILAFARERLASFKVPRSLDFEAELPRQPSGKLYVRRLRDRYWEGRDRRI